jgi:4-amino-4-deoxy-L-arabinose transferase-like glycosyltransferase
MTLAEPSMQPYRWRDWWWALPMLFFLSAGLGGARLFDVDEGAFSEATREMLSSGDWGHTTLNGRDRFDKPIGVYWLQAFSMALLGPTELAVRLPSALATWGACLALAAFVRPRGGAQAALIAAVVHATSLGPWIMAHAATADALLGLWLMLAALDLWRYLEQPQQAVLCRLAVWCGLGFLTKGPVALLLPGAVLVICVAQERRWGLWRGLLNWRPWAVFSAVAMPWFIYAFERHGIAFWQGFFLRHNIERFTAPLEGHGGGWLYFAVVTPLLWLPWTPLLGVAWLQRRRLALDASVRWSLVWVGFVLVFFSLSGTKLPHYAIYAAPGMALLLTHACRHATAVHWHVCLGVLLAWHGLMLALPHLLQAGHWLPKNAEYASLLQQGPKPVSWLPVLGLWSMAVFAVGHCRRRLDGWFVGGATMVAALVHGLVLAWGVLPWWSGALQGQVYRLALQARSWPGTVVQAQGHWPSFAFYLQKATPLRYPETGELALLSRKSLREHPGWVVVHQDLTLVLATPDAADKQAGQ